MTALKQRPQRALGLSDPRRSRRGRHGFSAAEIWAIVDAQGGVCAVCGSADWGPKGPEMDHDHELARTHAHPVARGCRLCWRAALCHSCNTTLGMAQDSEERLAGLVAYLERWRARAR